MIRIATILLMVTNITMVQMMHIEKIYRDINYYKNLAIGLSRITVNHSIYDSIPWVSMYNDFIDDNSGQFPVDLDVTPDYMTFIIGCTNNITYNVSVPEAYYIKSIGAAHTVIFAHDASIPCNKSLYVML
jgi:hypothetical protein